MALTFGGTTQKCQSCQKTVYYVDQLQADGRVYHKACFRCQHCKGTLKLSNYSSIDGALYCKPHFDQLFKMTGSFNRSFEGSSKPAKVERSNGTQASNRFSSVFLGTQDKCALCKKTVYPIEKVSVNGTPYHRPCFRCSHGGCVISPSNFVTHEGKLYCKHHHTQLFMAKGNFSNFEKVASDTVSSDMVSDVKVSDDKILDVKVSDDKVSDVKVSDDKVSDVKISDDKVSDVEVSDEKAPAEEAKVA